ncbi:hypothetical protein AQUCO_00600338v1 [Aquilegia coerulea]|uniref:MATH domain-containing protein n=1 Tax=Aquilegia coerulea TaxID=218851 RepID=A0A2G5EP64_AQUCA|nr:hypothetical protein AQUCO_00600338v1 [Aquilegia coerulea]
MKALCRSTRDAPPSHFMFKIESFSSLVSSSIERYESYEFDAGNFKWKLALYPNGNTKRDGEDHISLYLVLDQSFINLKKEILVMFSLFVFDHIRDKYLSVQDLGRFHTMKSESGFDKFLTLKVFNDPLHGYLNDDTCMFGAEVFVTNSTTQGQCLSMLKLKPYRWIIENFSNYDDKPYFSDKFTTGSYDWKILFYPKGNASCRKKDKSFSLFLDLADAKTMLPSGKKVIVDFKLRVVNQLNENDKEFEATAVHLSASLPNWGLHNFLNLNNLNNSTGYLVNDTCILEAEVSVLGLTSHLD